jgi:hypothetical protein
MSLISILFLNKGGGGSHKILNCRVYGILSMELVVWLNLWLIGVGNFVIGSKWKKLKRIIEFETLKWILGELRIWLLCWLWYFNNIENA